MAYSEREDRSSVLIQHGPIRLILTSSKTPLSEVSQFIHLHGDGVKDIAFVTKDVTAQFELAIQKKHQAILAPTTYTINDQIMHIVTVSAFGDITHTFIHRQNENCYSLPFFNSVEQNPVTKSCFRAIDHLAVCVHKGDLSYWVNNYVETYGFIQSHEEYVVTAHSGMRSKVIQSSNGQIKIVFVEPVEGLKRSQVAEFLNYFGGPGVQHIAFATDDIVSAIKACRSFGLEMLSIPDQYYEAQKNRPHVGAHDLKTLRDYSILFDESDQGFLYQIFSKPEMMRPTLFFEIIQRMGCDGFGSSNINTLFQMMEQEQLNRETADFVFL